MNKKIKILLSIVTGLLVAIVGLFVVAEQQNKDLRTEEHKPIKSYTVDDLSGTYKE